MAPSSAASTKGRRLAREIVTTSSSTANLSLATRRLATSAMPSRRSAPLPGVAEHGAGAEPEVTMLAHLVYPAWEPFRWRRFRALLEGDVRHKADAYLDAGRGVRV